MVTSLKFLPFSCILWQDSVGGILNFLLCRISLCLRGNYFRNGPCRRWGLGPSLSGHLHSNPTQLWTAKTTMFEITVCFHQLDQDVITWDIIRKIDNTVYFTHNFLHLQKLLCTIYRNQHVKILLKSVSINHRVKIISKSDSIFKWKFKQNVP